MFPYTTESSYLELTCLVDAVNSSYDDCLYDLLGIIEHTGRIEEYLMFCWFYSVEDTMCRILWLMACGTSTIIWILMSSRSSLSKIFNRI